MIKKILSWMVFVALFAFVIIGFAKKDKLHQFMSQSMVQNANPMLVNSGDRYTDSLFNYRQNGVKYDLTFLEFGAKGCTACRKMETVMEEVSLKYPQKVNVVFLNILLPENQMLMKYYGIVAIPTQVLLNKDGKEFYRHTGFLPTTDLVKQFKNGN